MYNFFLAFLRPCKGRRNLHISINSFVEKILINPETKTAEGVLFRTDLFGQKVVMARQEVILSAGAVQSPQILMLSGVGPKEHLEVSISSRYFMCYEYRVIEQQEATAGRAKSLKNIPFETMKEDYLNLRDYRKFIKLQRTWQSAND